MKKYLIILVITLSFNTIHSRSTSSPKDRITSCLSLQNINNFTTLPNTYDEYFETSNYYKLLKFSIQNLRFVEPDIPKPLAIVLPESAEELANSVVCCREAVLEIRIRSGGHSYEGTSFVASDGLMDFVIIDMMNLNKVLVDKDEETAVVEGGATLGEVYYDIADQTSEYDNDKYKYKYSYGFSAGSCPTVGVGGHIGGGGFGLLSRKYGLAADNVVDAVLVDAEGRFLDRKGMGEDVFWAIRGGGGGSWGIVYSWKIKLLRVPKSVTAFIAPKQGTKRYITSLINKWQNVAPNLPHDFYLSCFVGANLPESSITRYGIVSAIFKGFFLGPRNEALTIINNEFPELGIKEKDCKEMSWIESIVFFSGLEKDAKVLDLRNRYLKEKVYFKAKSDYAKTPISIKGIKSMLEILEKEPKGYVILDPYGGIMNDISSESIAFPHRKGNLFTIQYLVEWKVEDDNNANVYIDWIRGFYNATTPYVSKSPRAAYINYMDFDIGTMEKKILKLSNIDEPEENAVETARVWGEKYFLKNYDKLVKAKTLIDPQNVFRSQQGIPSNLTSMKTIVSYNRRRS